MSLGSKLKHIGFDNNYMKKLTVILIIILVLASFVYFYMKGNELSKNSSLLEGSTPDVSNNVGAEVLALLNQVKLIKIDSTIFESPVYKTLVDYTVEVPPQPVGRPNPFAPVR